jgi:carbonic anhydrase
VFDNLPKAKEQETSVAGLGIDLNALLPDNRAYYSFTGSLTTPPCSEDVSWFVLKTPAQVSAEQVARFGRVYAMNARPVQPLNGRVVQASQ